MIAYGIVSVWYFRKSKGTQEFARLNKDLRLWLELFIYAFNITLIIELASFILGHFDLSLSNYLDDIPILALVLLLYIVSYYAIRYPVIFELKTKYQRSKLAPEQSKELFGKLQHLMETERQYLNADLRLDFVANLLSTSPNNLSRVINELEGKNFQDFINAYRVEALKVLLKDNSKKHFTILALGLEAGFSSKTAMNRAFKKQVGCSPSDYQKNP
ncbi:MAG: hypothetical protein Tsb0034_21630 [Ekhidna sp.]